MSDRSVHREVQDIVWALEQATARLYYAAGKAALVRCSDTSAILTELAERVRDVTTNLSAAPARS